MMLKKHFLLISLLKTLVLHNIFAKEQHLFEVEILYNNATFDQLNVSFLNKILSEFSSKTKNVIDLKLLNSGYITSLSVAFARHAKLTWFASWFYIMTTNLKDWICYTDSKASKQIYVMLTHIMFKSCGISVKTLCLKMYYVHVYFFQQQNSVT